MAFRVITVVLNASTAGLSAGLGRAGAQVAGFSQQMNRALGFNPKPLTAGIAGITVALGYSVLAAVQFEARMRNVASIDDDVAKRFKYFGEQILEMSRHLPQSANNLAEGFYQIASSGFHGNDALRVLAASGKAAAAGLATTSQAVTAITATLNAYGLKADQATRVSDTLFATVNYGVITFPQLTQALSHVVGTAARAGISIEDMSAAMATMTLSGLSASESGVSLNQVLSKLLKPSKALTAATQEMGISLQRDLRDPAIGLKGVIDELRVSSEGNIATLLKWFPEIRAARGVLALMANDGNLYNRVFRDMGTVNATAGATQKAFKEQMKATSAQLKETWNQVNAFAIGLGTHLLPGIQKAASGLADFFHILSTAGSELWSKVAPGFASIGHSLQNLGQFAKGVTSDLAPLLMLLAGISIGAAVVTFRALASVLQGVTGFLADNKDAVVAVGVALTTLLLPALGRLLVALGLYMVIGINATLIGLGRLGTFLRSLNPLLIAAQVGIGLLAFSFLKSRQETQKFNGAVKEMTSTLAAARSQGPEKFMKGISDAIAPLAPMLRDAGVQIGPLVNNLSKGGSVATEAWRNAEKAALIHAHAIGANAHEVNAIKKSYEVVGKALHGLNEETKNGTESQRAQAEAFKAQLAQLDPLGRAQAAYEQRAKTWQGLVGEANKALGDQNDLLKENTKQTDINAKKLKEIITNNVAAITKENTNIIKLQAAGLPSQFIAELIKHGPEYVAAVAGMGKQQMTALADEWRRGQTAVNQRANLLAAQGAGEQAKAYSDSLRSRNGELAKVHTEAFIDNLNTAVNNARKIASSGGQTTVDEYGRKVHASAGTVLQAYIHSLPEPLRSAVQQALGIAGPGGQNVAQRVADGIRAKSGAVGAAANEIKDKVQRALDAIKSRTAQIAINEVISRDPGLFNVPFATGGYVNRGTGFADDVPARLKLGEYVMNPKATARFRPILDRMNWHEAPAFATGGLVGPDHVDIKHYPTDLMVSQGVGAAVGDLAKTIKRMFSTGSIVGAFGVGGGLGGAVGVQRWSGVFATALRMAGQSLSWLPLGLRRLAQESGGNPFAINRTDINAQRGDPSRGLMQCLTLDAKILTRRGWLAHDEVRVGDETIGYNPQIGRSEWTAITKVVHYEDAEVWRIGNNGWHADVTPNHRWWSDTAVKRRDGFETCPECGWVPRGKKAPQRGVQVHRSKIHGLAGEPEHVEHRGEFVRTHDFKDGHRLRVAAVADTDGIPGLSIQDVQVLAWLQGDGTLRPAGTPGSWDGAIWQSKPAMVVKLRALLSQVEHTESVRQRPGDTLPAYVFRLRRAHVTDLMKRSELAERGPEDFVLALSPDQRAAWLDAMIDAEGHRMPGKKPGYSEFVRIAQVDGPVQDAIRLAVYLEGYRPTYSANSAEGNGYQPAGTVGMAGPHVVPSMFHDPEVLENQTVWCVKTALETWTAEQHGQVFLTGNTIGSTFNAYAGALRGRGIYDPLANIYAAIRYTVARYGSLAAWGRPGGYAAGGMIPEDGFYRLHHGERVVPASHAGSTTTFNPIFNITVMGGDSPQVTAQAIRQEMQGMLGNFVRQIKVGTGRY